MAAASGEKLTAEFVLEYAYQRSLGPVLTHFFTGLKAGRIFGVRTASNQVLVPPPEADPQTGTACFDMVEVGQAGVITGWSWEPESRPNHPLTKPFAWVLVKLDGADSALLHCLDVPGPEQVETGMRVRVQWVDTPVGSIRDIRCFVAEGR